MHLGYIKWPKWSFTFHVQYLRTMHVEGAAGLLTPRAPSAIQVLLMCSVFGCKCSLPGLQPKLGNPGPVVPVVPKNERMNQQIRVQELQLQSKNLRRTRLHYEPLAKGPGKGSWKTPQRWLKKSNLTDLFLKRYMLKIPLCFESSQLKSW